MVRIVVSALLALLIGTASASDIFVIQSRSVSDVYGESIGHQLKEMFPTWNIRSISLRDFDIDRFTQSREITVREIRRRAETHDNLVLLGHEVSTLEIEGPNRVILPPLIGTHGAGAATPSVFLHTGDLIRRHVPGVRSVYYILSDPSPVSQLRLREFRRLTVDDRTIEIVSFNVKRTSELRAALIAINSKTREPGIIIHNIFSLVDEDSFRVVYSDFIDTVITRFNTRHVEMGVLKPRQTLAVGVGASPRTVARAVESFLTADDKQVLLESEIGINLERVSSLGLNMFVMQEGHRISHVGADSHER